MRSKQTMLLSYLSPVHNYGCSVSISEYHFHLKHRVDEYI